MVIVINYIQLYISSPFHDIPYLVIKTDLSSDMIYLPYV